MKKLVIVLALLLGIEGLFFTFTNIAFAESYQDVIDWYNDQIPVVEDRAIQYLQQNVKGINDITVYESKFAHDVWGANDIDFCYIVYFECKMMNKPCMGEAWGFRKYKDNNISWIFVRVFDSSQYYVDGFNYEYEGIMVDYYNYLVRTYK